MSSLSFIMHILFIVTHTHTHTHTHARTHARMHAHTGTRKHVCLRLATGNSLPSAEALALLQVQNADGWRLSNIKAHAAMLEILYLCQARSLSQLKKTLFVCFFECGLDKKKLARRRMASIFFWKLTCYDADSDSLYGGSLQAPEGATTSHLRQPPQERSMRSARSLSPPQSCTGRKCHRIEYELLTFGWASAARQSSFMQFLDGLGAVRTLNELMEERSQRFDISAHEQIHTEAAGLNVLHVNAKHHSAALRQSTSKKY